MNKIDGQVVRRIGVTICALLVGALLVTACGSSSHSSSTGGLSGGAPASTGGGASHTTLKGRPIKVGMIADVGVAVDWSDEVAAARAGVRQVNSEGGINGHMVVLDFCNEALNPNTAEACARRMVSDHVMAMADDGVATSEGGVNAILRRAGIAQIGTDSFGGVSASDPNTYMTDGFEVHNIAAMTKYAVSLGDKRLAMAVVNIPATAPYTPEGKAAAQRLGATLAGTISVPQTFSDLSTQAAALMALHPQAVLLECSEAGGLALVKEMAQLGYTGKFLNDGNFFTQSQVESLGSVANQVLFVSPFPPVTATDIPGMRKFAAAVEAEKAAGDKAAQTGPELVNTQDVGSWLAVKAIAKIANAKKASDAASFKKSIDATKNLDLDGVIPPWTPNKANPKSPYPRVVNPDYYEYSWKDGKVQLASTKSVNIASLIPGTH